MKKINKLRTKQMQNKIIMNKVFTELDRCISIKIAGSNDKKKWELLTENSEAYKWYTLSVRTIKEYKFTDKTEIKYWKHYFVDRHIKWYYNGYGEYM